MFYVTTNPITPRGFETVLVVNNEFYVLQGDYRTDFEGLETVEAATAKFQQLLHKGALPSNWSN